MFDHLYKLLSFFRQTQMISGRKKLQKMVYLLQHYGLDLEMNYVYHHYGPYSAGLQAEVEELVESGFVAEGKTCRGYEYHITEKGIEFLQKLEEEFEVPKISMNDKQLDLLGQQSSQFLEVVSTYAFLLAKDYLPEQAVEKVKELKPHLADYVDEARAFYDVVATE